MGFRFGYDSILGSDLNLKITMKKLLSEVTRTKKNTQFRPKHIRHGKVQTISLIPVKKGPDGAEQNSRETF